MGSCIAIERVTYRHRRFHYSVAIPPCEPEMTFNRQQVQNIYCRDFLKCISDAEAVSNYRQLNASIRFHYDLPPIVMSCESSKMLKSNRIEIKKESQRERVRRREKRQQHQQSQNTTTNVTFMALSWAFCWRVYENGDCELHHAHEKRDKKPTTTASTLQNGKKRRFTCVHFF